jgi:hypothetical protein
LFEILEEMKSEGNEKSGRLLWPRICTGGDTIAGSLKPIAFQSQVRQVALRDAGLVGNSCLGGEIA